MRRGARFDLSAKAKPLRLCHLRNAVIINPLTVPNLTLVQVAPGMRMVTTLLCGTLVMILADWPAAPRRLT